MKFTFPRKINREILRLAIPNIVSNVSVPLLSSVDTALMGHLSALHLGAIGLGSMIFNFIYWNFNFLRMGTTGLTAQAHGRRSDPGAAAVLTQGLLLALALSLLIWLARHPFIEAGIWLMNAEDQQAPLITTYFLIRILAAPATLGLYVFFGWFFGKQNAIYPLLLTVLINVVNIAVSVYLVVGKGMEIAGVAWGTVIAQYTGLVCAVLIFISRYRAYAPLALRRAAVRLADFRRFLMINRDIFFRTICLTIAFGFFYSRSSVFGPELLAVNVVLMQFMNWMSYGIDGFAFAAESLVGKYYGAGDDEDLKWSIRLSFAWGLVLAILIGAIYGGMGSRLFLLFSDDPAVLAAAGPFLWWVAVLPLAGFASYIWDGIYVGITAAKAMRNSMAASLAIYFLCFFLFRDSFGNHALWIALMAFLLSRALFQQLLYAWKGAELA